METDDLAACADLCESHGFAAPAAALRALAERRVPFYTIYANIGDNFPGTESFDEAEIMPPPRRVFCDRTAAERHVRRLTIRTLRNYQPILRDGLPSGTLAEHFFREVDAILGTTYELPTDGDRLFPDSATDERLARLEQAMCLTLFFIDEFGGRRVAPRASPSIVAPEHPAWRQPPQFSVEDNDDPATNPDELLACSDLCEENRFPREAAMLRALAGAGGPAHIVVEHSAGCRYDPPRLLFFDRAQAECDAIRCTVAHLRGWRRTKGEIKVDYVTSLAEPELDRRVSSALGINFKIRSGRQSGVLFPASATDEQMMAVARLFDKLRFFHVLEAEFGG